MPLLISRILDGLCTLLSFLLCPTAIRYPRVSRKEERIALGVLAFSLCERLIRIVFLPDTRGENVLILLVPSAVYHLCDCRIVVVALKLLIWKT